MHLRTFFAALAALAVTAIVGLGFAGPASATYGPESDSATVSATAVDTGGTVTVNGDRFCPGSAVTVTVSQGGEVYLTQKVTAGANGRVSVTVTLTEVGSNTVTLTGKQSDCTGSRVLGVKVNVGSGNGAVAGTADGSDLPRTGGVDFTPLYAGLGLLVAGSSLILLARSRRTVLA